MAMTPMPQEQLNDVIRLHSLWAASPAGGKRADLSGWDLSWVDLHRVNLRRANLSWANLSGATLRGAILSEVDLSGADLSGANLVGAILTGAILTGADLTGADLRGAIGNMREVKSMQVSRYRIVYTRDRIWVGCVERTLANAWDVTADEAETVDPGAGVWWTRWRRVIRQVVETSMAD